MKIKEDTKSKSSNLIIFLDIEETKGQIPGGIKL